MTTAEHSTNVIAASERFARHSEVESRRNHPSQMGGAAIASIDRSDRASYIDKFNVTPMDKAHDTIQNLIIDALAKQDTEGLVKVLQFMQSEGLNG